MFLLLIFCHWSHIKPSYSITKVFFRKLCWLAFLHTHPSMSDFRPYLVSIYIWCQDHQILNNAKIQSQLSRIVALKIHCVYKGVRKWVVFLDWYPTIVYTVMSWKGYVVTVFTQSVKQNRLKKTMSVQFKLKIKCPTEIKKFKCDAEAEGWKAEVNLNNFTVFF